MAGYMYLGSQRVCPAVLVGGGGEPENTYLRFPDDVTTVNDSKFEDFYSYGKPYYGWPVDVDFNNVEVVSGTEAFYNFMGYNRNAKLLRIKNLRSVTGEIAFASAFSYCSFEQIDIDFEKIEEMSGTGCFSMAFVSTVGLPGVIRFTNLTDVSGSEALSYCFWGDSITDIYFNSLTTQSFGSYKNQFSNMLLYVNGCTLHFPSSLESFVSTLSTYPNFGGTNTTILYDLPATE